MRIRIQELTADDLDLIGFACSLIDANTDGKDGGHTFVDVGNLGGDPVTSWT